MRFLLTLLLFPVFTGCWSGQLKRVVEHDAMNYMCLGDTLYRPASPKYTGPHITESDFVWLEHAPAIDISNNDVDKLALLRHENTHAKQMKGPFRFFWFLITYNTSKSVKRDMELEAYEVEIATFFEYDRWNDGMAADFAWYISDPDYGFFTYNEAANWVDKTVAKYEK